MDDEALISFRLNTQAVAEFMADDHQYKKKLFNKFLSEHESNTDSENVEQSGFIQMDVRRTTQVPSCSWFARSLLGPRSSPD